MKFHRIWAINLRYLYLFRRSFDRISDVFYWPAMDLFIWGLTSSFFTTLAPKIPNIILMVLSGHMLWLILWRGQYEITVNLLEDLWNKNLINIFVAPLKFWEWVLGLVIQGIIKALISFSFAIVLVYFLYKVKIFFFGFYLLPFMLLLIISGWSVGFFVAGLILRYGTKVQTLAWTFAWLLGPFSAIYYPVSILPEWAQMISAITPTSYIFEGMREVINKGYLDKNKLAISFLLNLIYLVFCLVFLRKSFDKVLEKGLVKVY